MHNPHTHIDLIIMPETLSRDPLFGANFNH